MKKVANVVLNDFTNDSRVWKISDSLNKKGFSTVVLAMHDAGLSPEESVEGVHVERIKLRSRPWPKWKLIQFVKYLEFLLRAVWRCRKVDAVHCNDLSALPVGLLVKLVGKNVSVIYDCHEYETETHGLKGFEKRVKKWLERALIKYADSVITVSDSIAEEYARLYNISKPHLVLNCPRFVAQKKQDLFREKLGIGNDQTIFLYQGRLGKGRGIELLLEAFIGLESDNIVLVCMGYGPLEKLVQNKAAESSKVYFYPAVEPQNLLNYTGSADYGIIFYEDTCLNHRYCSPNKAFEYIMAGLPVFSSNLFEMKRLVETEGVGVVSSENTVEGFKDGIEASLKLNYDVIQENVFNARQKFSWEAQEKVLIEVYHAL